MIYWAIAAFSAVNTYQSYKDAGKAAMNEAVIKERQLKTKAEMIKLGAAQEHNARVSKLET